MPAPANAATTRPLRHSSVPGRVALSTTAFEPRVPNASSDVGVRRVSSTSTFHARTCAAAIPARLEEPTSSPPSRGRSKAGHVVGTSRQAGGGSRYGSASPPRRLRGAGPRGSRRRARSGPRQHAWSNQAGRVATRGPRVPRRVARQAGTARLPHSRPRFRALRARWIATATQRQRRGFCPALSSLLR